MQKMKELMIKYKEMIMYLIFGTLTTLINWIAYALFVKIHIGITVSNALAWIVAVLFAFVTNKLYVFESKSWNLSLVIGEFIKFVGARVLTGILEIAGLPALYYLGMNQTLFGVDGLWAKVIISIVVMILNFVFSKLFVFKGKEK